MRTKILILTTLSAALLAAVLLAQPGPPHGGPFPHGLLWEALASDYDQNDDGQITRDELDGAEATFSLLDRNDDGVLSEDDSRPRFERRMRMRTGPGEGPPLLGVDADGNGTVTAAEWQALFAELDADGNGELSGDELPMRRHRHRG